jgi:PmbA protein
VRSRHGDIALITNSGAGRPPSKATIFFSAPIPGLRLRCGTLFGGADCGRQQMQRDALVQLFDARRQRLASPEAAGSLRPPNARWPAPEGAQDPIDAPVLSESPLAAGLLGGFRHAVSGGALYRSTFQLG